MKGGRQRPPLRDTLPRMSLRAPATAPLRKQLFIALVVPAVVAMGALAFMADLVARNALEKALGARLCAVAQAAATAVSPQVTLLERGDDDSRLAKRTRAKLKELAESTDVARVFVVAEEGARIVIDTKAGSEVGEEYTRARFDGAELDRVRAGNSAASVLFSGVDGRTFKTGYAPLMNEQGKAVGYAAVVAPTTYADAIGQLRTTMGLVALASFVLLLLAASWSARRVAVPLSALSDAAERIGAGELDAEIPSGGPLEAEVLAQTMRGMTASLKTRDEEMQLMLAGIAHEVRNPLGGIELFGGLLKEDLEDDPRQKHVLKILRELGTLSRVVNDFLDFARKRAPEPRKLSVFDLCFEVVSLVEGDAAERGVAVELDVERNLEAQADPESLKRAVLNLVRNAVQAAPAQSGHVRLSARHQDGRLELIVEDDGPGVPLNKRAEIFTPFFTTKQKGTGLGLALSKKTAEAHGGLIQVSEAELGGARFVLSLPHPPS